ncbi:MAG TPA: hypothetical protein DCZ95_04505 [Verrucomicrobia bacterium]|nr:MAG: hypothetical protein A2X46_17750 [Lentisphaerae bacterium GWF2_57_35]HBA83338.1 hypothetical protein [Verrucomicrobiota bacterium]
MNVVVADYDIFTAYGHGVECCWKGLISGKTAVSETERLKNRKPGSWFAATSDELSYAHDASLAAQMLERLLPPLHGRLPPDTLVLLATTAGEIDLLEKSLLKEKPSRPQAPASLLDAVTRWVGLERPGHLISCACASSSMAMTLAAHLISLGRESSVLVAACDAVTEFVMAGFGTMSALAPSPARPFHKDRDGLNLGDGAGWLWLLREDFAQEHAIKAKAYLTGWSAQGDYYHMTAPDPEGCGLSRAMDLSLDMAGLRPTQVDAICAHGTGTRYNDDMEMHAFERVLGRHACPVFSVKGGIGHTLGAAGLVEAALAIESLRRQQVPPSIGADEVEPLGGGRISSKGHDLSNPRIALSTNSGFGGVNTSLVVELQRPQEVSPTKEAQAHLIAMSWADDEQCGFVRPGCEPMAISRAQEKDGSLLARPYKNWGRLSPLSKKMVHALALALKEMDTPYKMGGPIPWGIVSVNTSGCQADNERYFKDYAEAGRTLARGSLFVYTLPTSPIAEAALHFRLAGPLFHVVQAQEDYSLILNWAESFFAGGDAEGMIVVSTEQPRVVCGFLTREGDGRGRGLADLVHGPFAAREAPLNSGNDRLEAYLKQSL